MSQCGAATWDDAFLNCCLGGVDGVFKTELLVLHLGFGGSTNLHNSNATGQLGKSFLQLLLVVGRVSLVHLLFDLLATPFHRRLIAFGNDRCGVLIDGHTARCTKHFQLGIVQFKTGVFGDQLTIGQHCHVFEHGLTAITKPRRLHGSHIQHTTKTIDHQGCESFLLNVLSNDQQGLASAGNLFEHRHQILYQANLLVSEENVGLIQHSLHPLSVSGEVRGDVALIETHPLGDLQFSGHRLALFKRDHTFLANFVHGVSNHLTHFLVVAGSNGSTLSNGVAVTDRLGELLNLAHEEVGSLVDPLLQGDCIGTSSHIAQAGLHHGMSQNSGCGRAITCSVIGLGSCLTDQSNTSVLNVIFKLNLFGDGDAIVDDLGCTKLFLKHHIAAFGPQCDGHGFGQDVNAALEGTSSLLVVNNALSHGRRCPLKMMDLVS